MKIYNKKIYNQKPRIYKEISDIGLEAGDVYSLCIDHLQFVVGNKFSLRPQTVLAKRIVMKDGTPKGPWLFSVYSTRYVLVEKPK